MLPISIDVHEIVEEFNLNSDDVFKLKEEILASLCNSLYRTWQQEARDSNLKKTKGLYLREVKIFREGQFKGGVELTGTLPNMIESGASPFNMKIKMLESPKVKHNQKGGTYITIPFRIGTPDIAGESELFSNIMSPATYKIAKVLQGKQQVKQSQLTGVDAEIKTHAFIQTQTQIFEAYTHQSSVFAGIKKGQGQYQGKYSTFRRISSTSSDPNSWIHKGIQAYNFGQKALDKMGVPDIVEKVKKDFLEQKFG